MFITLNYKIDKERKLRNWNDALVKAPSLKRENKIVFYLRSCSEISS